MNYEYKIESAVRNSEEALKKVKHLQRKYKEAKVVTSELLQKCEEKGVTRVSIGKRSNRVPSSEGFPFNTSGSVFTFTPKKNKTEGWPAIWGICDSLGVSGGCGNSEQRQLSNEGDEKLIDGLYELRNGVWIKTN